MSVAFVRNQILTPEDLNIKVVDDSTIPPTLVDPYSVTFTIYNKTSGIPIVEGQTDLPAVRESVGRYYVNWTIPATADIGDYTVQFNIIDNVGDDPRCVEIDFNVVLETSILCGFLANLHPRNQALVCKLRILLRDNNPDKYYHFRPPNTTNTILGFTERIGFIWTDEELFQFIVCALDAINAMPPQTFYLIPDITPDMDLPRRDLPRSWESVVVYHAAILAARAVGAMWVADEFDYNISGISLNLEKSQKYAALADAWENTYRYQVEAAKRTVKLSRGLQQRTRGAVAGFFRTGTVMNVGNVVGTVRL